MFVVTYHFIDQPEAEKQASSLWHSTREEAEEYITYLLTKPTKRGRVYTVREAQHPAILDVVVIEDEHSTSSLANQVAAHRAG